MLLIAPICHKLLLLENAVKNPFQMIGSSAQKSVEILWTTLIHKLVISTLMMALFLAMTGHQLVNQLMTY